MSANGLRDSEGSTYSPGSGSGKKNHASLSEKSYAAKNSYSGVASQIRSRMKDLLLLTRELNHN